MLRLFQLALFSQCVTATTTTVHDTQNDVVYHGTTTDDLQHFRNVKYAHDTSGDRRFAPPVPYIPSSHSEVDATMPGPACPQLKDAMPPFFSQSDNISEDCLSLRITRPIGTNPASKLPVVVWLHGGGVVKGSAYDPHFEPNRLVSLSQSLGTPIIYVALNYRITAFGFASLPILKRQKSLNVGMRDQEAGFQWVKNNIEMFGGDSTKVTAFGLSAGGTFTSLHLMAYGGEKDVPFTQAWTMSGPPGTALNVSSEVAKTHTLAVAEKLECTQRDEYEQLKCLQRVPMERLLSAAMEYSVANHPPAGLFTFIPTVDGDIVPTRPSVLYRNGNFAKGKALHTAIFRRHC
jgi:carboxylesterase type B